ncbi:MAG: patatin-like phospholipase family protein [Anaerolineae bacterium]
MKPFRKNVAIAIDGGGIRGVIVTRGLSILEQHLGRPVHDIFRLAAGTSTGSIISAGIGAGLTAEQMHELYVTLGHVIFRKTLRSRLWVVCKYRYPLGPIEAALREHIGDKTMGDFWAADPPTDVVITAYDLVENRTRFIKPWKAEYADWPVTRAVLASSSVPTFFPPVEGRYVDGGVGAYANPCYIAAYEAIYCLGWDPAETTLLSFGTGHYPTGLRPGQATKFWPWQWLEPLLGAFMQSTYDEQLHVVGTLFPALDFRRYQVTLREDLGMDAADRMDQLVAYGDEMGQKVLDDEFETIPDFRRIWPRITP